MKLIGILAIATLVVFSYAYAATPFFANGGLTKNGIEWCEENYQLYKFMGHDFFEHHHHSIESRVCGNLYNDPLWLYTGHDRYERLIEKSKYYTNLEIEESKAEAESGVIDTKPVTEQETPQIIAQQQKELEQKAQNNTQTKEQENSTNIQKDTIDQKSNVADPTQNNEGGGCLIATAAYGSELAVPVQQLRELRDSTILKTSSGAAFMESFNQFYYSFSPAVADYERQNPVFKEFVKIILQPMITSLSVLNHTDIDSESEMISYGIGMIVLNVGMYVGVPAAVFVGFRKYRKLM